MLSSTRPIICSFLATILLLTTAQTPARTRSRAGPLEPNAIQPPVLKWQKGGCYSSWCETGWYSSPAVADLDGDGSQEVIGAAYSTVILTGTTGLLKRRIDPPVSGARAWPGVVVADVNADGKPEIITAQGSGYVRVLDRLGNELWTRQPTPGNELRSLAVYDLDKNSDLEILVASTKPDNQWWVYEHDGTVRTGQWPQHYPDSNTNGYSAGCFNENIAVGDLDGDERGEIIGPSDVHYITAYQDDGTQMRASAIYGLNPDGTNKFWSRVGVHVDHAVDLRGYANCDRPPHPPLEARPNFADSAPTLADVNGDGTLEVIVVGNNYDCRTDPYTDLYHMPFIFKGDRTRWSGSGFDWTAIPIPDNKAAPLTQDWNVIETAQPNPVAADLDGDGKLEILYASYDGRVHAYWLDKTEHGSWPYEVYDAAEGFYRFGSEPVVADLDNDGKAEVIFASWPQSGNNRLGKLHILSYQGTLLQEITLPAPFSGDWNGGLAAPTLANIDADADLEVVLNTAHSGLVAFDLPGTSNARILWGTGRGNYQRSGSILQGTVQGSSKSVRPALSHAGDTLTYTLLLQNPGPALGGVLVTDTLPAEVNYAGNLWASAGSYGRAGNTITWTGNVSGSMAVTITFNVTVSLGITTPRAIVNTALIDDRLGNVWPKQAAVIANGFAVYLPVVMK